MPQNRTASTAAQLAHRMATRLKMKHLLLLRSISELGTLTRVAERMATSQPAVTQALAELESLFGAPLFLRSARGMEPTELGALVLARARGMLADAIGRTRPQGRRITVTLHEDTSDRLLQKLRAHELDCVIGRASAVLDMSGIRHSVLYEQEPRLIAHRSLATRLGRRPLQWAELTGLDWVLGQRRTPMREQITDFFLRAGVEPPPPFVETLSAKVIGELVAANERAVSIVPADIAEELVRIAGVGIVRHRFGWTLPPITLFERKAGGQYEEQRLFAQALKEVCSDQG